MVLHQLKVKTEMNSKIEIRLQRVLTVGAVALCAAGASHAAMDTSAITSAITDALTAIGVVGAAVMGVHVAVKAFRWVRAAMA